MKALILLLLICSWGCSKMPNSSYVDPFIGTGETHFISKWRSEACTYPGAVAPHGMVQISPETSRRGDYLQGYYYKQDTIRRFSLTEHFSGWPDGSAGKAFLMPVSLDQRDSFPAEKDLQSFFRHRDEVATAGFYSVFLEEAKIKCDFTALTRSVKGRLIFEKEGIPGIVVSGLDEVERLSGNQLQFSVKAGSKYISSAKDRQFLVIEFDTDFNWRKKGNRFLLSFPESATNQILFKYSASYTSADNARENLLHEIPGWDFEKVRQKSASLWDKELSRIDVKGSETDKTIFYTALYHASLIPVNATDINRQFPGFEKNDALREDETHYIYFTPWDAFRTSYPLFNLINPKKGRDYLRSALRYYKSAGNIPEPEVMTGVHFTVMFADALAKQIDDFDTGLALKGLQELLWEEPYFRKEIALYDSLGYVPFPENYATTATLEFAYNDWALSQVAGFLGKESLADSLLQRSFNYRNNYHPGERFMLSRKYDGSWSQAPVYAEADKWNMSWFVPHNTQDLINLMGGDSAFCEHLNRNFEEGHFVLDNECPLNFPFLFTHAGKPWLSMKWKHQLLREYFNDSPGGIPGNDDWGSISSWFTWGALGLFPVTPGTDELILTPPLFEEIRIHFDDGNDLFIEAPDVSDKNIYIQKCFLKEKEIGRAYISQNELRKAGHIRFETGDSPNIDFASGTDRPFSVSAGKTDIQILSLQPEKNTVQSHEDFLLHLMLLNTGEKGSIKLVVHRNEEKLHSEWVLLDRNEKKKLSIPVRLYKGGQHTLSVGNQKAAIEVIAVKMENERAVKTRAPVLKALIHNSEDITLKTLAKNISGYPLRFTPEVIVDDQVVQRHEAIELLPGENRELSFHLKNNYPAGFHTIQLNNGPSTRFKVYEKALETMVLHYDFNQSKDSITDLSGFDNHGNIKGWVEFTEGYWGKGIRIINGHISIPDNPSLEIIDEVMTLIARYRPEEEKGMGSIVTKGTHNMMKMNGKWQIKTAIGGWGRGQCAFNSPALATDSLTPEWLHSWCSFATVKKPGKMQLFYNGELVNELPHIGKTGDTDFEWRIGDNAEKEGKRRPEGIIDEVMIFAGALTQQEIRSLSSSVNK